MFQHRSIGLSVGKEERGWHREGFEERGEVQKSLCIAGRKDQNRGRTKQNRGIKDQT